MESSLKTITSTIDFQPGEDETKSNHKLMEKLQESTFFQTVDIELYENGKIKRVHKDVNWKAVGTVVFGVAVALGFIVYKADTRKVNQIIDHMGKNINATK
jgi:hypothetical protein